MMQTFILGNMVQGAFFRLIEIAKEMVRIRVNCQELPRIELVKKF